MNKFIESTNVFAYREDGDDEIDQIGTEMKHRRRSNVASGKLVIVGENKENTLSNLIPSVSPENPTEYNMDVLSQEQIQVVYDRCFKTLDWIYK